MIRCQIVDRKRKPDPGHRCEAEADVEVTTWKRVDRGREGSRPVTIQQVCIDCLPLVMGMGVNALAGQHADRLVVTWIGAPTGGL